MMGFVMVRAQLGKSEEELREVELLADTGSFFTLLPPDLATSLGIQPTVNARVVTADRRQVVIGTAMAYIRLNGRESAVPVGVMDVPMPILGVSALEALGLKVNPVDGTLEHSRPFGPAAL